MHCFYCFTLKKKEGGASLRSASFAPAFALSEMLLDLDLGAGFFQLGLDGVGLVLGDVLLDGSWTQLDGPEPPSTHENDIKE